MTAADVGAGLRRATLAALLAAALLPPSSADVAGAPQAPTGPTPDARAAAGGEGRPVPPLFGGIQVNEPDQRRWVRAVDAAGLDSVQVTLYARQALWDGPELWWDRESPWVEAEIRAARRAGLRTVLVMRVALEHGDPRNRHLWHGMIWPREDALEAWWAAYREFVLHGARLARREDVDLFVVGNELNSMASTTPVESLPPLYDYLLDPERVGRVRQRLAECADEVRRDGGGEDLVHLDGGRYADLRSMLEAEARVRRQWALTVLGGDPADLEPLRQRRRRLARQWRDLVADVRKIYPGPISYGANFDQYMRVGFWDALDAVAVTGYFPLSRLGLEPGARLAAMEDSWRRVARDLRRTAGDAPVILLELGWTRRLGSTVRPWSYDRVEVLETAGGPEEELTCVHWASQPLAPQERVAAMRALRRVVEAGGFPALRGLSLWKLTTRPEHRRIEPFAVLLPAADVDEADAPDDGRAEDRELLRHAAAIAEAVRRRAPGWHNDATGAPPGALAGSLPHLRTCCGATPPGASIHRSRHRSDCRCTKNERPDAPR